MTHIAEDNQTSPQVSDSFEMNDSRNECMFVCMFVEKTSESDFMSLLIQFLSR